MLMQDVRDGNTSVYDAYTKLIKHTNDLLDEAKINKTLCKEWKEKYKDLNRSVMCELRDPYGTIWEHAKRIQDENDNLKKEIIEIKERHMRLVDSVADIGSGIGAPLKNYAN